MIKQQNSNTGEDVLVEKSIERVAVIGAGLMGFGIGVEFARFGYQVSLYNTIEVSSRQAMQNARDAWGPIAERVARDEPDMKSGKGFYDWPDDNTARFLRHYHLELIRLMKQDMAEGSV